MQLSPIATPQNYSVALTSASTVTDTASFPNFDTTISSNGPLTIDPAQTGNNLILIPASAGILYCNLFLNILASNPNGVSGIKAKFFLNGKADTNEDIYIDSGFAVKTSFNFQAIGSTASPIKSVGVSLACLPAASSFTPLKIQLIGKFTK